MKKANPERKALIARLDKSQKELFKAFQNFNKAKEIQYKRNTETSYKEVAKCLEVWQEKTEIFNNLTNQFLKYGRTI